MKKEHKKILNKISCIDCCCICGGFYNYADMRKIKMRRSYFSRWDYIGYQMTEDDAYICKHCDWGNFDIVVRKNGKYKYFKQEGEKEIKKQVKSRKK